MHTQIQTVHLLLFYSFVLLAAQSYLVQTDSHIKPLNKINKNLSFLEICILLKKKANDWEDKIGCMWHCSLNEVCKLKKCILA